DYMILRKDVRRVETGGGDRVIRDFRQRMEGRKIEAASRRGTIKMLGMLCSVLSVAVLAGGVVMFNNYQKMREMETVLVSVLPSGVKGLENYIGREDDDNLVVEQIKGKVYPTEKSAEEAKTGQSVLNSGESVEKDGDSGSETAGEMQPESEARPRARNRHRRAGRRRKDRPRQMAERRCR
ncbi:MAG: peptidoglycan-binding protein, partial [Eisenbergiella sp.]